MPVNTPCQQYEDARSKWARVNDCFGGRDAILAAGEKYLPMLQGDKKGYAAYQLRASFFNALKRTVQGLVGLIFQKPPVTEGASEQLDAVLQDITPRGRVALAQFAQRMCVELWKPGRVGVLIDMAAQGTRPYAVLYRADAILSWTTSIKDADEAFTRVVLAETVEVPDPQDPFVMRQEPRCRVLEIVDGIYVQAVWKPKDASDPKKSEWVQESLVIPARRGAALDVIPFLIIGPTGVGAEVEDPPLLDLADCNLGHYRNSADLEQGLHMIAIPTPYVCGLKPSDGEPLPLGPSHVWELEPAGSAGMIEYSGQGVKDIREEMSEKKRQMAALGARVLEDASASPETATAIRLRHGAEQATVRTVAESLEQALTLVAQWLGWWQGLEATPADVKVTVSLNKEFFALKATPEEVKAALLALQAGEISYETFYERLKQGGWARDGVTAEQERQQIEAEGRKVDPNADPNADPEVDSKENTQ